MSWTAVVLAGSRPCGDPVAQHCGVAVKALAEVGGEPMLCRVIRALGADTGIGKVCIVGDRALLAACLPHGDAYPQISWCDARATPAASLCEAFRNIDRDEPVVVTTCDHALLRGDSVRTFLDQADKTEADLCLAMVSAELVRAALPQTRRTVLKFSDLQACTCNLFAFRTQASRSVSEAWQAVETQRKRPWRLLAGFGVFSALRYLLGRLSLTEALERLSRGFGVRLEAVVMPFPLLAVDVDTPADLHLCRQLASTDAHK